MVLLNVDSWTEEATLNCDSSVAADLSIVQYSPCGKFLIATSLDGDFIIWNISTEMIVNSGKHEKSIAICGLMWNPKGNKLNNFIGYIIFKC